MLAWRKVRIRGINDNFDFERKVKSCLLFVFETSSRSFYVVDFVLLLLVWQSPHARSANQASEVYDESAIEKTPLTTNELNIIVHALFKCAQPPHSSLPTRSIAQKFCKIISLSPRKLSSQFWPLE